MAGARLRKHADYQRAYAASRKRQSASMSWFLAPQPPDERRAAGPRIGLTAGKVLGKAHERNRIKRRMREALRRHLDLLPAGVDLILHPRRTVLTMEFAKLEAEIVRILQQAKAEAARIAQNPAPHAAAECKARIMTRILLALLAFYRRWLSPALHSLGTGGCRYLPTCSEYAVDRHLPPTGRCAASGLALWRLLRCHPFTRGGLDPVPPAVAAIHSTARPFPHEPLP